MSGIDERVVKMTFDNKQFEDGVKTTLNSLDALNKGLKLEGATKGLDDVSNAASRFSLQGIADSVSGIGDKFKAMSIIGITALANLASKAVDVGLNLAKSLTVSPIKAGLDEYETNLNSIQTILSNTAWQHTGLADVNAALAELNTYSDKTIYNFTEMARNIGTFTAAGVKLDTSVNAIKGIANLAAISGSSAEQASGAMYQLSQALATGTLKLQDWNSVVNAGMGGKVFQDALIETARVHGVAVDQIIKDEGSFRDSLQKGWLTSSILTETLSKFTGDLTAAQLKTMGYNDQQIAGILKMGKDAQDAATKVKTFSQLLNTLQEAAGSGWTNTWQIIFGDFEEARTLFTNVNNVLGGFITASANARNKVLGDWKALGGRTVLIDSISNAFNALITVLKPIKEAFSDIFPPVTGQQLYNLTVLIDKFSKKLTISSKTADELHRTFAGVFSILGIGLDVIKAVLGVVGDLTGVLFEGSGGFLEFTARVGDFLVNLRQAIHEGDGLTAFFTALGRVLAIPLKILKSVASAIGSLFGGFDGKQAADDTAQWASKLEVVTQLLNAIADGGDKLNGIISHLGDKLTPMIEKFIHFFSGIGTWIADAVQGVDWSSVLDTVNTGLFAGLVIIVQKYGKTFLEILRKALGKKSETEGFLDTIKESIGSLTDTLGAMQNTLRAATLLEIAAAILLLAISVVAMSKIDPNQLTSAMAALSVMFTELFASMAIFQKVAGSKGFAKMPLVTGAMILLAIAIDLLVIAVKALSTMDWEALGKGLTGLTIILGELVATMNLMPESGKMISSGLGMILLATAINILVTAVTNLSGLSWEEMAKGLSGVAGLLLALGLFTKFAEADKAGVLSGAGLLLLAVGVKILADSVVQLSGLSWEDMAKGLVALAGAMAIMVAALDLIPPTAALGAAGFLIMALSLGMVADALEQMGQMSWMEILKGLTAMLGALTLMTAALYLIPPTAILGAAGLLVAADSLGAIADFLERTGKMSWGEIGKSMVALTGVLTLLGIALTLMIVALPGAAAMLVVAAALAILAPILMLFGNMSWEEMGKGLLMLAGVFTVMAAAGILLTPVVPTLLGLGVAITLLGVGMLAAGVGILAFSIALTALSVSGAAGAAAIVAIVQSLAGLIPFVMAELAAGIVAFAQVIATAGPAMTEAMTTVLNSLIDAIAVLTPKIQETLAKMLLGMLEIMLKYVPDMVRTGLKLLTGILQGIADNIGGVVTAATNIVVNFINALAKNQPRVIQAGVDFIISYIHGLTDAINNNSDEMGKAGGDLAIAIVKGMVNGLKAGAGEIANAAKNAAKQALNAAKDFLGIGSPSKEFEAVGKFSDEGMAIGLDKNANLVADAAEGVGATALDSMTKSLSTLSDVLPEAVDLNPTITPVLDLTSVSSDAKKLNNIFSTNPISVTSSSTKANNASTQFDSSSSGDGSDAQVAGNIYNFNQYNSSPKALSEADIYRQTKNQLSAAKGALP